MGPQKRRRRRPPRRKKKVQLSQNMMRIRTCQTSSRNLEPNSFVNSTLILKMEDPCGITWSYLSGKTGIFGGIERVNLGRSLFNLGKMETLTCSTLMLQKIVHTTVKVRRDTKRLFWSLDKARLSFSVIMVLPLERVPGLTMKQSGEAIGRTFNLKK